MNTVLGIFIAVIVFGLMIVIHEFGHYIVARLCKVKILEFAVGMGPKIFSKTSAKTGIAYSLRAFPIGGFTAMQGEDGEDDDPHAFVNRPRWQRLLVLLAGGFFNILTGMLVMFIYLAITAEVGTTTVARLNENNISASYGLQVGDKIIAVDNEKMVSYTDVINSISLKPGEPVDLKIERNGEILILEDVMFPTYTDEESGIAMGDLDFLFLGVRPSLGVLLQQTFTQSIATIKIIYKSLFMLITGKFGMNSVSGPIGTVSYISQAASLGITPILYLFSFISINLGVMNLLPLPALDGGRIIFILIEAVRRKPLKGNIEGYIHFAGMAVLLLFMLVVAYFDIAKLFFKG